MNQLVRYLSQGDHPLTIGGPDASLTEFQKRITEIGYVFVKFTDTRGGTDLGVRLDKAATDTSRANLEDRSGVVHVEGTLTLNYVPVRCIADIDLSTLTGTGHLVIREQGTAPTPG